MWSNAYFDYQYLCATWHVYVIKITNVIKKLTYNYVPHDMFDVTKLIKMIRTLAY